MNETEAITIYGGPQPGGRCTCDGTDHVIHPSGTLPDGSTPVAERDPITWRQIVEGEAERTLTNAEYDALGNGNGWRDLFSHAFEALRDAMTDARLLPMDPDDEPANTFVSECRVAGIDVRPYHGRFYWKGPGVWMTDEVGMVDVARATTVDIQQDSPVIYPSATDEQWYDWAVAHPEAFPLECEYCGEPLDDEHTHDDE